MTPEPTKAQELERLAKLAAELADYPYLRELMAEAAPLFATAIRNDFCTADLAELWAEKARLDGEVSAAKAELARVQQETARAERRGQAAAESLAEVRRRAARIAADA